MDKVKLTVVTLTRNNEAIVKNCLKSVYGWAAEIIVVDDESSDNTLAAVKPYADKVFSRKMDVEGVHRNWAYAQAANEWVLSLDSDEIATDALKKEISLVLAGGSKESGFSIPRRNYIGDYWVRHGGWYPSPQLKLFRKEKFRYEEVAVHPRAFLEGVCGHLKGDIIHYSYKDFEDFWAKMNRQTSWEARKWFDQGKPMRLGRFLWRTFDRFFRSYLGKRGFKDGLVGFVVAFNAGLYQIWSYLKYREMMQGRKQE